MSSIRQIVTDIVLNLNDEKDRDIKSEFYNYDRSNFIKSIIKRDGIDEVELYPTSIQTITTEIVQLSLFNEIIYHDEVGEKLVNNFKINEIKENPEWVKYSIFQK